MTCVKATDPRLQHLNVCAEVDHLNGREIVAELGSEKAMRCCHDGIFRVVSRQLVFWIFLLNVFHSFGPRNEESAYHSFCRAPFASDTCTTEQFAGSNATQCSRTQLSGPFCSKQVFFYGATI